MKININKYTYYILLLVLTSCFKETAIPIEVSFNTAFINDDMSVPVLLSITNTTVGADTFEWTFEGAETNTSMQENPNTVVYNNPGTYTISLTASNIDGVTETMETQITVVDAIAIGFSAEIQESNFPPVEVALTNNTIGSGLSYQWNFQGGTPSNSSDQTPENVIFETPGEYQITLEASNGFETFQESTTIIVAPDIDVDFEFLPVFFDDDFQAPVTINTTNNSISATDFTWNFEGGLPNVSNEQSPSVTFNNPGTYTISLSGDNGKRTDTAEHTITVLPDTNLRSFQNIELGINTAHSNNTRGAFFSTTLREVFSENQVNDTNSSAIDLVFFGLNDSFGFNQFISPDMADSNAFNSIANATQTKFINTQEGCNCGTNLTVAEFDDMTNSMPLDVLTITETPNGSLPFNSALVPRIVLFETHDGRKGAIKINQFVVSGLDSYINCDIKVQKVGR